MRVLVTGGAGFIGSHTADALIDRGRSVRILDSLEKPVHTAGKPAYLHLKIEFASSAT
jgi:dTDP-L-rhamnose 4-epimerase